MKELFYAAIENTKNEFLLIKKDTTRPERIWEWSVFIGNGADNEAVVIKELANEMGLHRKNILGIEKIGNFIYHIKTNIRMDELILLQGEETIWVNKEHVLNYPLAPKTKEIFKNLLFATK